MHPAVWQTPFRLTQNFPAPDLQNRSVNQSYSNLLSGFRHFRPSLQYLAEPRLDAHLGKALANCVQVVARTEVIHMSAKSPTR
jgi:hypothetical protein